MENLSDIAIAVIVTAVLVVIVLIIVEHRQRENYAGVDIGPAIIRNNDGTVREVLGTKYYVPDDQPYYVQEFVRTKFPTWKEVERRDFTGIQHNPAWIATLDPAPPKKFPANKEWGVNYATYANYNV